MNARSEHVAGEAVRLAIEACVACGANPSNVQVPVATYETQLDLDTLRPEDHGCPIDEHRRIVALTISGLRANGFRVREVQIKAEDYLRWLAANKLPNDASSRARYVASA